MFAEEEAAILVDAAGDGPELDALTARRVTGEPLEHLVGWVAFGRLRLAVGPGVFIPRQRSLRLARAAVRAARAQAHPVVLEAYAGVAPLAATVAAALPGAEVHAADIDPTALGWARMNLPERAGVHLGDRFDGLPTGLRGQVTLIAAVTPYVPSPRPSSSRGICERTSRRAPSSRARTASTTSEPSSTRRGTGSRRMVAFCWSSTAARLPRPPRTRAPPAFVRRTEPPPTARPPFSTSRADARTPAKTSCTPPGAPCRTHAARSRLVSVSAASARIARLLSANRGRHTVRGVMSRIRATSFVAAAAGAVIVLAGCAPTPLLRPHRP